MATPIFNQTISNFYVRDPRTTAKTPNGFYNDNNQSPTIGGIYSPNSANPSQAPLGTTSYGSMSGYGNTFSPVGAKPTAAGSGQVLTNYIPSASGYANNSVVPGLRSNGTYNTTPAGYVVNSPPPSNSYPTSPSAASENRLSSSNLPSGAVYKPNPFVLTSGANTDPTLDAGADTRVFVSDPSSKIIGAGGPILSRLSSIGGVLFPYTPIINIAHKANYESEGLMHTNYDMPIYKNSTVDQITLNAKFTANSADEAQYVMAVIHFFRSATKMFYGQSAIAGTPPPVLRLDGHGDYMLNHLPVVCTNFDYSLPDDVDYISTSSTGASGSSSDVGQGLSGGTQGTMVPTMMQMNIGFKLVYSRNRLANGFGLENFASGGLLVNGKRGTGGPGGFI